MTAPRNLEPDRIGEYRLDALLGRGATSSVYRAHKDGSKHAVALKAIRIDSFLEPESGPLLERFRREAEIGMRLDHPGIVKVFEFFADEVIAALVMEFIEGEDLARRSKGNAMDWRQAVSALKQVLFALSYAHRRGVIHRDVKPANLILTDRAEIKLADFGIARLSTSGLTSVGDVLGTPAYMAPEQLTGSAVDARADLFSAGATLYALLAGRPPYTGSLPSVMHQILYGEPDRLSAMRPEIPKELEAIVVRATAKDPTHRFASADDFIAALDAVASRDRHPLLQSVADETVIVSRPKKGRDPALMIDQLDEVLALATSESLTETALSNARALCADLNGMRLEPAVRARVVQVCSRRLETLADVAASSAPIPGAQRAPSRSDFISVMTLMGTCRPLLLGLGADADSPVRRLSAALQDAVAAFAASLSERLAGDDSPDLEIISAQFMRIDVLQLGLNLLGAHQGEQSLATVQAFLVNQIMARVNSAFRRYRDTGDQFAGYEIALLLSDVEEMIVLAERLVARSANTASAFSPVGRLTLSEFVHNISALAESAMSDLLDELRRIRGRIPTFASQIKQIASIYIFATRFDDEDTQGQLHKLSARLYDLMKQVGAEIVSQLKASLVKGEASGVRAHAEQLAAIHELARDAGWERLGTRLLTDLRNHVVADPSLRSLFAFQAERSAG